MAFVTTDVPAVGPVTFVGPVMSYYEHVSSNFLRLTDEAWETAYSAEPSFRPDYVNLYLANGEGNSRGAATVLVTGLEPAPEVPGESAVVSITSSFPNPFTEGTVIGLSITQRIVGEEVEVAVFDVQGRKVRSLFSGPMPAGHYTVEWDGRLADGSEAASGVYFGRLQVGSETSTRALIKLR